MVPKVISITKTFEISGGGGIKTTDGRTDGRTAAGGDFWCAMRDW